MMAEDLDTEEGNFGTGLHAMIISYDEATGYPSVDLGDIPPYVAISLLRSVIDALDYLIPTPKVTLNGETVLDPFTLDDDDND
jgi:hypothetical protein